MIFRAWKAFVVLSNLSKATHWGWLGEAKATFDPRQKKGSKNKATNTMVPSKEMLETPTSKAGFGVTRHHQWLPTLANAEAEEQQQLVSHNGSPSLASPFTSIFVWAPRGGSTPSHSAQQGESPSPPRVACSTQLWAPCMPLGLGTGSAGHKLGQRELLQTQSFSPPLPAVSFGVPNSPLQHPGVAKVSGQSQSLLFSCWGSGSLQPSGKGVSIMLIWRRHRLEKCLFPNPCSKGGCCCLLPCAYPIQAAGPVSCLPVPCQQVGPSLSLQRPATFLKLCVFTPTKLLPAKYLNSSFSKQLEINMRHMQCCGDTSPSTSLWGGCSKSHITSRCLFIFPGS